MGQQLSTFDGWEQPSNYSVEISDNRLVYVNDIECGLLRKVPGDGNCLLYSLSISTGLHTRVRNYISTCAKRRVNKGDHLYVEDVQYAITSCQEITCVVCIVFPIKKEEKIWWTVIGTPTSSFNSIRVIFHIDGCHFEPLQNLTEIGKEYIGSIIHNFVLDNSIPNVFQKKHLDNIPNLELVDSAEVHPTSDEKIAELLAQDINAEILKADEEYVKKLQSQK